MLNKYLPNVLGGIENHIAELTRELCNRKDVTIDLLAAKPDVSQLTMLHDISAPNESGVKWHEVDTWKVLANTPIAPKLTDGLLMLSEQSDIIHMHMPYPFGDFAYLQACKRSGALKSKPLVVTYHSDIVRQKKLKKLYEPTMHKFLSHAHTIIVASPQLKENSIDLAPYKDKVQVVPFACDVDYFDQFVTGERAREIQSWKGKVSLSQGKRPLILFVGRLVYYKGVDVLLRALTEVDADLFCVGDGPLKTSLVQTCLELNLQDRVYFINQLSKEELAKSYAAADVLCLPSVANSEAFGLVQIEAHASKTATVSSKLPTGVSFATKDGMDGLLFEPGNSKDLANKLNTILSQPELLEKLSQGAYQRAHELFSFKNMIDGTYRVYQDILEN